MRRIIIGIDVAMATKEDMLPDVVLSSPSAMSAHSQENVIAAFCLHQKRAFRNN